MGKILFLIIIGILFHFFYRKIKQKKEISFSFKNQENVSKKKEHLEELVECEKCNTFVSIKEIRNIGGKNICKGCYENR